MMILVIPAGLKLAELAKINIPEQSLIKKIKYAFKHPVDSRNDYLLYHFFKAIDFFENI
jgi:hypothetical protein